MCIPTSSPSRAQGRPERDVEGTCVFPANGTSEPAGLLAQPIPTVQPSSLLGREATLLVNGPRRARETSLRGARSEDVCLLASVSRETPIRTLLFAKVLYRALIQTAVASLC